MSRLCLRMLWLVGAATVLSLSMPHADARAQGSRLIPVEDATYWYLERLQRRGLLLDLDPTALPYTERAILQALDALDAGTAGERLAPTEERWLSWLRRRLGMAAEVPPGDAQLGIFVEGGIRAADSRRLDPLRPLGDTLHAYPYGRLGLHLAAGRFALSVQSRHDLFYNDDPDGLDTALRAAARSENAYAGYQGRWFALYLGRYSQHWAPASAAGAVVSRNPRSYDHVSVRLGGDRLNVRALLGELDSVTGDGRFTGTAGADSVASGAVHRFLAAHAWTWRPRRNVVLRFVESTLYSGPGASPSLKYLNPLHGFVLVVDNRPKNVENNGFVGGQLWWHLRGWTLHGQLLFDDLDLLGQGDEPASITLIGSLHRAGLASIVDVGVTAEVVAARTYNTNQAQGRYLYLRRGLATQFSDYVLVSATADVYLDAWLPGLTLTPAVTWLGQGERDIRGPFPRRMEDVGFAMTGTAERTTRVAATVRWQPSPWWWFQAEGGVNRVENAGFVDGASATRFAGLVSAGLRLPLEGLYSLSWR